MTNNWIILDRDGVINSDSDAYIKSAEEWQPIAGSIEAIVALKKAGYSLAVVTNQSGLSRGLFSLDDLEAMHTKMQTLLEEQGACIDAIFYCPHGPDDNCRCRKPKAGMLDALESEFAIQVEGAYLIGDSLKDLQLATLKACKPILVQSGKGTFTQTLIATDPILANTPVFKTLKHFSDTLLEGSLS